MHQLGEVLDTTFELERTARLLGLASLSDLALLNWIGETNTATVARLAAHFCITDMEAVDKTETLRERHYLTGETDGNIECLRLSDAGKRFLDLIERRFLELAARADPHDASKAPELSRIEAPACVCAPMWGPDGKIADARFIAFNDALVELIPDARKLKTNGLFSQYAYPAFRNLLAVFETVARVGEPRTIKIATARDVAFTEWKVFRSDSENILCILCEQRRDAYTRYKSFYDTGPIKMILDIENGRILDVNRAAELFYGWDYETFIRMNISDITRSSPEMFARSVRMVEESGYVILHVAHRIATGETRKLEVHSSPGIWNAKHVHFSIVIDRSASVPYGTAEKAAAPKTRQTSVSIESFRPFIELYRKVIPDLQDLFAELIPFGRIVAYETGEHFMEYGYEQTNTGFILGGVFRKYSLTADGKDYTLGLFREGEIIQPASFTGQSEENPFALEARCACTVFIVSSKYLQPIMNSEPKWFKLFHFDQCAKFIMASRREMSLLHDNATIRYKKFSEYEGYALKYLRSYHIASYLGITSETLSRVRNKN